MFESLDKMQRGLLVAEAAERSSQGGMPEVLWDRIYNRGHLYSHLSRHVSKSSSIERINLRRYDMFIAPCLSLL